MPDPWTRAALDAALAAVSRSRDNAVIEARCPTHPDDGCLLREQGPCLVEVHCWTCLASVARLAVATPPVALAFGTCRVHGSVGCRVLYAGQGVVDAVCWTCGRIVVSLPLAPYSGDADVP